MFQIAKVYKNKNAEDKFSFDKNVYNILSMKQDFDIKEGVF